jgi:hypothetical protein
MKPVLHIFANDLLKKPLIGSKDPPRTIRAKDLDDNNRRLTVLKGSGDPLPYGVRYTKEGTLLTGIRNLPEDAISKQFDVCENGSPTSYYFVVWNEEPQLPFEEEEPAPVAE